jgi:hypothetical protein
MTPRKEIKYPPLLPTQPSGAFTLDVLVSVKMVLVS